MPFRGTPAALSTVELVGEPISDRGFTLVGGNGTVYRARLKRVGEVAPAAYLAAGDAASPSSIHFMLSVVQLDAGEVVLDPDGRVIIMASSGMTIMEETLADPDLDFAAMVHALFVDLVNMADTKSANITALLAELETTWGDAGL